MGKTKIFSDLHLDMVKMQNRTAVMWNIQNGLKYSIENGDTLVRWSLQATVILPERKSIRYAPDVKWALLAIK